MVLWKEKVHAVVAQSTFSTKMLQYRMVGDNGSAPPNGLRGERLPSALGTPVTIYVVESENKREMHRLVDSKMHRKMHREILR